MNRRSFLTGMGSLFAAPAIVHAGNLMPIKVIPFEPYMLLRGRAGLNNDVDLTVRIYEKSGDPMAFLSPDFFNRYQAAAAMFNGSPEQVGVAHTREEEKIIRMTEVTRPTTWTDIKKHNVAWDGSHWSDHPAYHRRPS